ncbi:MAG: hypothetical protein Terrestrivirus2_61 [Terrestrivirus sp.]|uniref:Uncharacterized protein n=1 Tax=Terrestrivirus sp. TaxID=2487775 RepID=A0A3G4ZPL9_9VIRU|nr:MAG: hypothetical protein Terrestrivirus2_61 [Terrestrivirus sp.]
MNKIDLIDPDKNDTPQSIVWHNLRVCDEHHDLSHFIMAAQGWFNINKTSDFQDFEKALREKNLNTHLYAKKPAITKGSSLRTPNNFNGEIDPKLVYECIYSCRPHEYALKELLGFWDTYEDNFNALKLAGQICVDDSQDKDHDQDKYEEDNVPIMKLDDNMLKLSEQLKNHTKKLRYTFISPETVLENVMKFIEKDIGQKPTPVLLGLGEGGVPIFGLAVDNAIVCDTGFKIELDPQTGEKQINLFDLKTLNFNGTK